MLIFDSNMGKPNTAIAVAFGLLTATTMSAVRRTRSSVATFANAQTIPEMLPVNGTCIPNPLKACLDDASYIRCRLHTFFDDVTTCKDLQKARMCETFPSEMFMFCCETASDLCSKEGVKKRQEEVAGGSNSAVLNDEAMTPPPVQRAPVRGQEASSLGSIRGGAHDHRDDDVKTLDGQSLSNSFSPSDFDKIFSTCTVSLRALDLMDDLSSMLQSVVGNSAKDEGRTSSDLTSASLSFTPESGEERPPLPPLQPHQHSGRLLQDENDPDEREEAEQVTSAAAAQSTAIRKRDDEEEVQPGVVDSTESVKELNETEQGDDVPHAIGVPVGGSTAAAEASEAAQEPTESLTHEKEEEVLGGAAHEDDDEIMGGQMVEDDGVTVTDAPAPTESHALSTSVPYPGNVRSQTSTAPSEENMTTAPKPNREETTTRPARYPPAILHPDSPLMQYVARTAFHKFFPEIIMDEQDFIMVEKGMVNLMTESLEKVEKCACIDKIIDEFKTTLTPDFHLVASVSNDPLVGPKAMNLTNAEVADYFFRFARRFRDIYAEATQQRAKELQAKGAARERVTFDDFVEMVKVVYSTTVQGLDYDKDVVMHNVYGFLNAMLIAVQRNPAQVRQSFGKLYGNVLGCKVEIPNFSARLTNGSGIKTSNFVPDIPSVDTYIPSAEGEDEELGGQQCMDRPQELIHSVVRNLAQLDCPQLISFTGCSAAHFFMPLEVVMRGCIESWWNACSVKTDLVASLPEINPEAAKLLLIGHCAKASDFGANKKLAKKLQKDVSKSPASRTATTPASWICVALLIMWSWMLAF